MRYAQEGREGLERCYEPSADVVLATVLRDPLEKALSWVFSTTGGLTFYERVGPLELKHLTNLSGTVIQGGMLEYTLTLSHPYSPLSQNPSRGVLDLQQWSHVIPDLSETLYRDPRIEERAVASISSEIDIVLLKERQCESLVVISHHLGLPYRDTCPGRLIHMPKPGKRETLPPNPRDMVSQEVLRELRHMLRIEYAVYNAGVERFNTTINSIVNATGESLAELLWKAKQDCPIMCL
jgi:hypothetical protein